MSKEQLLAGISPYVLRLASYYACLGVGTYRPKGYAQFDRIEVRVKMPWQPGAFFTESCLILVVEFFVASDMLRYVEFALTPAGFSGKPVVQLVAPVDAVPKADRLHAWEDSGDPTTPDICKTCGRLKSHRLHDILGE